MRKPNYQSVAFFLFAMCIFTGCTRKGSGKTVNETQAEDSVSFVSESDSCKQPTAQDSLKKLLLGYWAHEDVTWMRITDDSIYYVDQDGEPAIKYFVSADTITMYYYGFTKKDRFWFVGDSLFIPKRSLEKISSKM
ncbi:MULTISPECIES: hypothetical protein [unclassified Bacteroides]|uniref:hypothetical protein n=1 Tax=unclassified Bacteroides TaxID=2646097 RepID=UPI0012DE51C5|nr:MULTISPECIES: hypothetical protein [unclassified Bacteroides]